MEAAGEKSGRLMSVLSRCPKARHPGHPNSVVDFTSLPGTRATRRLHRSDTPGLKIETGGTLIQWEDPPCSPGTGATRPFFLIEGHLPIV